MIVDGESLLAGAVIDVSGWRNAKSLESMRYIAFVQDEEPKVEKPKGRQNQRRNKRNLT